MRISYDKPDACGMCDISGFMVRHSDLVKQMEYKGNGLYWTGLWVHKDFADKPNPQGLTPPIYGDPKPVDHPRIKIPVQN
jgi:hypothetical protein